MTEPDFDIDAVLSLPVWQPLPDTTPIPLMKLNHDTCRWPVSIDGPSLFCGCKTAEGSPWCPTHRARSIGKGTASERAADNLKRSARPAVRGLLVEV